MLALRSTQKLGLRALLPAAYKNVGRATYSSKDDDSSSSDDEKKPKKQRQQQPPSKVDAETAAQRLNRLLSSMQTTDQLSSAEFQRPGEGNRKRRDALKQEVADKDIVTAAKNIASMLGTGESERKQTESELLAKLLGHSSNSAESAKGVGAGEQSIAGATAAPGKELNLSELIVGMKIDRRQQPEQPEHTRGEYVRRSLASRAKSSGSSDRYQQRPSRQQQTKREAESFTGSVNLYGGEPLAIFNEPATLLAAPDMLATWSALSARELSLHAAQPPANYYEKLALWTEQGKAWRFPLDNEQDMLEEVDVDFSEHIFLEQHLEPWCPSRGPIRHFMELVCVGLSKNPHITALDKKEHIFWFRDYFEEKRDILKDLMSKESMGGDSVKSVAA